MNWALVRNTVHRLLTRPRAIAVIIAYGLYTLVTIAFHNMSPEGGLTMDAPSLDGRQLWLASAKAAWILAWALGSGLLGQERSDGHLPLLLSRPISRGSYVLSRWIGLVLSVLAIEAVLNCLGLLWLLGHGTAPAWDLILGRWAWFFFFTLCTTAWLSLLSACFGGHGDFFLFLAASLCAYFLGLLVVGAQGIGTVHRALAQCWAPGDATYSYFMAGDLSAAALSGALFLAAAATCLALACYVMQRRDISYVNR